MKKKSLRIRIFSLVLIFILMLNLQPTTKTDAAAFLLAPAIGGTVISVGEIAKYTFTTVIVAILINASQYRVYQEADARSRFIMSTNLPKEGAPNSVAEKRGKDGKVIQKRWYDNNGKPQKDIDYTDHGTPNKHPNPHQHDWTNGVRGPAKSTTFPGAVVCNNIYCLDEIYGW